MEPIFATEKSKISVWRFIDSEAWQAFLTANLFLSTDVPTFPRGGKKARCRMLEETTTHRSSDEGRQTKYSRETFLAVTYTNVSHPDGRGWADSFLRSA